MVLAVFCHCDNTGGVFRNTYIYGVNGSRSVVICSQFKYFSKYPEQGFNPRCGRRGRRAGDTGIRCNTGRDKFASTPGVKNAATRRLANGNLTVRVQLYQAVAQWTDGEQYYPLSADGTIVNNPTTTRNPNTVVFRGDVPNDISNITNTAHNMVADLDYLEFIEKRRWNLHTLGGITVMLPERDPAAAIASLMILDKNHKILSRDIDVIDMRDDSRILIK